MSTDPIRALCAEMAAELDHICQCLLDDRTLTNPLANRARALLERQAAPVPVPVAERLPGPEDCDAEGRCWMTSTAPGTFPGWILDDPEQCVDWDRWLPAHALPLPAQGGEVQPDA